MSPLAIAIQTNPLSPPTLMDCDANAEGREQRGYRRSDINRIEHESLIKLSRTDTDTWNLQIFPNLGIFSFMFWFRDYYPPFSPLVRSLPLQSKQACPSRSFVFPLLPRQRLFIYLSRLASTIRTPPMHLSVSLSRIGVSDFRWPWHTYFGRR